MTATPPTLSKILLDAASSPWSLGAFTAYLSENHCLELLEFLRDSQRYASLYEQLTVEQQPSPGSREQAHSWWKKLMQVYITPSAPRQINIPSGIRDSLLRKPCDSFPPHPSELDEACRIVYELMDDSLLVPFLQSVAPTQIVFSSEECDCSTDRRPPATMAVMSANSRLPLGFTSLRRRRAPHRKRQWGRYWEWRR
ncbi:hypothetical protein Purlil1_13180 [Purpureocillium lilacinum]|uniref:RGS domain-containing protein n=1 Tax=Purpureocillium lilacinum TaxID=33203 RepID=A0ABR0BEU1_PURLI|nr:hypothetical protein Purlil1_13180 [Purpureocillium lilacinum]